MPISTILEAETYLDIPFKVPHYKNPAVEYKVRSSHNVMVYLIDEQGFIYFENNDKNFYWYGGGIKRAYHKEIVEIPESGDYHLIIWNQQKGPIKIEYDLHILK